MPIAFMLTSPGIGGGERQVIALARQKQARGHRARIIVLAAPVTEEWPTQVEVIDLDLGRSS